MLIQNQVFYYVLYKYIGIKYHTIKWWQIPQHSLVHFIAKSCVYTQILYLHPLISICLATVGRMNLAVGLIKLKSNKALCKCANPIGGAICNFHNDATAAKAFTKRTQRKLHVWRCLLLPENTDVKYY